MKCHSEQPAGKILFLGGAGFIGSNIIKWLATPQATYEIYVIEPAGANVSRLKDTKVTLLRMSISETRLIAEFIESHHIDTVVHLVSTLIPGSAYEALTHELRQVVYPTVDLLRICAEKNVKFVFFSSGGTVYGNKGGQKPFTEDCVLAPISYYGWTKQLIEDAVGFMHRTQNLSYLIVRPSNLYGQGQNLNGNQGLIAVALGCLLKQKPLHIWGDGSTVRDYLYIEDLCEAFTKLLEYNVLNTIINIGSGIGYSINEVLESINRITGATIDLVYDNARPVDISSVILDITRLKSLTDVRLTPLEEGIGKYYKFVTSTSSK